MNSRAGSKMALPLLISFGNHQIINQLAIAALQVAPITGISPLG
jgi:hypothetical protein